MKTECEQRFNWIIKFIQKIVRKSPKNSNKRKEKETTTCDTIFTSKKHYCCKYKNSDNGNDHSYEIKTYSIKKRKSIHNKIFRTFYILPNSITYTYNIIVCVSGHTPIKQYCNIYKKYIHFVITFLF